MSLPKMLLLSAFASMLVTVAVAGTANGPTGVGVAKACYLLGAGLYAVALEWWRKRRRP